MDRPLHEFKELGRRIHRLVVKLAKNQGLEVMAGPQGQVIHTIVHREEAGQQTLVKDIEQELHISKSVASNLIKRMQKNDLLEIYQSQEDRRAKFLFLTEFARSQVDQLGNFFHEVESIMLKDISAKDYKVFLRVMKQFYTNMETIGEGEEDV